MPTEREWCNRPSLCLNKELLCHGDHRLVSLLQGRDEESKVAPKLVLTIGAREFLLLKQFFSCRGSSRRRDRDVLRRFVYVLCWSVAGVFIGHVHFLYDFLEQGVVMQPERTESCVSSELDMNVSLGSEITGADPFVCHEQTVRREQGLSQERAAVCRSRKER